MNALMKTLADAPEIEPSNDELLTIRRIETADNVDEGVTLNEMDDIRKAMACSGKLSLRVPRTLHYQLMESAKKEGISLNQYALYKLAK